MKEVYVKTTDLSWITDYYFKNKDIVSVEELVCLIQDLIGEKEDLEDKVRELESDIEDNYRPIPKSEQYAINNSDFI